MRGAALYIDCCVVLPAKTSCTIISQVFFPEFSLTLTAAKASPTVKKTTCVTSGQGFAVEVNNKLEVIKNFGTKGTKRAYAT